MIYFIQRTKTIDNKVKQLAMIMYGYTEQHMPEMVLLIEEGYFREMAEYIESNWENMYDHSAE